MLRVGVAGAGAWARRVHVSTLSQHPLVEFIGVWARRGAVASELAERHGGHGFDDLDALLDEVDVLAVAIDPRAQAAIAIRAALAGRHLLLEKPLAPDPASSRSVRDAVLDSGVRARIFLSRLWDPARAEALAELDGVAVGGDVLSRWRSAGMLTDAHGWRGQVGVLQDVGPHILPTLERAAGLIVGVIAREERGPAALTLELAHAGGATSRIEIDLADDVPYTLERIEAAGADGFVSWQNNAAVDFPAAFSAMVDALCADVDGRPHEAPEETTVVGAHRISEQLALLSA